MPSFNATVKPLLLLPIYILAIFSWSKSYKHNPVIGNYWLNRMGLHVFRVLLAHSLFVFRLGLLNPLAAAEDRAQFRRDGFILKENFLPPEQFAALKAELLAYQGPIRELKEGNTLTQRVYLNRTARAKLPMCAALTENPALLRLVRYASSKNRIPLFYAENLCHELWSDNGDDPQKHLHCDTFFPSVKAWLFLDAVSEQNGPFTYVPGSQRLTWRRLRWEYAQSLNASRNRNHPDADYWDGSFRVTDEALQAMGCEPERAFTVAANTLIIANVHGFHRRGFAEANTSRLSIWMQTRDNPFEPYIILCPQLTAKVFEHIWEWFLKRRDARFQRTGRQTYADGAFRINDRTG